MRIYKILSLLLAYPGEALQRAAPEIAAMLPGTTTLPADVAQRLAALAESIGTGDLVDTQEAYVALFDQTRSLSLYLFEHVHGESRDRGQAMVDLRTLYEEHGLAMEDGELPDFLPLFLEFLDTIPQDEARGLLGDVRPIAETLAKRLGKRRSAYAAVLDAIVALAPATATDTTVESPDAVDASPDAVWAEAPVRFTAAPTPIAACPGELS